MVDWRRDRIPLVIRSAHERRSQTAGRRAMRILIVKLGSIGDIVHTLPSLAVMRRAIPEAEISWVVEQRTSEILRDNPLLDRLIEIDTKALRRGLMSGETDRKSTRLNSSHVSES